MDGTGAGQERWRAVFLDAYPGLLRHLTFLLGDRAAAEDIAQEAFLRLFDRPPRKGGDPKAWLHAVAVHLSYNYLRAERRRQAREDAAWSDPTLAPRQAAEAGAPGETALVRQALAQLQPRDRLLLLLRAAGRPYQEIAPALGVRPSSVGTLVARATERFRRAYAREAGDTDDVPAAPTLSTEGMRTQ